VLEGVVGGLLNGKIALHQAGNFLKTCPEASQGLVDSFPFFLKIINSHTKEVGFCVLRVSILQDNLHTSHLKISRVKSRPLYLYSLFFPCDIDIE